MSRSTLSSISVVVVVVVIGLPVSDLGAQEYRSFADVHNFCPTCEPDRYDRVRLKDGREVRAWLVAENDVFYVLERHGELRAVARKLVEKIEASRLRDARERSVLREQHRDHILLKNGHVNTGTIVEVRHDTGMYRLRSATGIEHLLYRSVISLVFENGKLVFGAP